MRRQRRIAGVAVRAALRVGGLGAVAALVSGCGDGTGVVEIAWAFVDRDGASIYPAGALSVVSRGDSCDFPGRTGGGTVPVDVRLELQICDPECAGGCDDPACQVVDPLRFPCDTARASDPNVPASDDPYRFTFRAVLDSAEGGLTCVDPEPTCIAVPGARERSVKEGLVTDLQVLQIVMDIELDVDESIDLEACGCG